MQLRLTKTPKNCSIIVGPPNFGMIGTIVTEFLISHLHMESIGSIVIPGLAPVLAVHGGEILDPIGLFFDASHNLLVVHVAANIAGQDEAICDALAELASRVEAGRIVCVDGLMDEEAKDVPDVWYVTRDLALSSQVKEIGMEPLHDGILSGPGAILLSRNTSGALVLVASCHAQMADSAAAASIVAALDEWLHIQINSEQLLEYTAQFEEKWRMILAHSVQSKEEKEKKYVSYVG